MKRALGYARVSGRTQALDGTGLQEQRAQCEAWAAHNGYEIVEWFEDSITGETPWDKRPAMTALVERVAVNGIDAVIVWQLDRIARGKSAIFEGFFEIVAASGVQVISTIDGILTDDPQGDEFKSADAEMIRSIKQAIIRQEKRKLVARMTLGKLRAKAAGKRVDGKYAFGADPNKPNELITLARMRQLRDAGLTVYRVCKILNAEGLRPRTAERWKPNVVAAILTREEKP
ncbi:MAG: recombinase family protein [Candidatus Sulfotelmatobacter sp.]